MLEQSNYIYIFSISINSINIVKTNIFIPFYILNIKALSAPMNKYTFTIFIK